MDYKITLTVGGETWQAYRQPGGTPGTFGKSDKDYLARVVTALTDALDIATKRLMKESGGLMPHIPKYE
ncbi:MAG: hypothetical protein V4649_04740 [Bacteroidota bacterium]